MKPMKTKNLLNGKISQAKKGKQKLFCVFLTLGYPNLVATERLILFCEKAGVDILELGFPFSDPLADGPTIQFSSEQALKKHVTIKDAFQVVRHVRQKGCRMPIVFFGYFNPIYAYGKKDFASDAKTAGFDGIIVPDLTPEEEKDFQADCRKKDLSQIFLVAPTTSDARASKIIHKSQGFVYYVSLRGVTGARKTVPSDLKGQLNQLRKMSRKPFLVGFGVSMPEQARDISKMSDGVIVGSAVIEHLKLGIRSAERFIEKMSQAVHRP
ncbi:MAG TPA: tryptophan synthase subunit alpha [Candidatus Omnitrophota bacterium]|nr:tryptophan synthase subunit alpha [Candidatus Omnitrophota bacterium]